MKLFVALLILALAAPALADGPPGIVILTSKDGSVKITPGGAAPIQDLSASNGVNTNLPSTVVTNILPGTNISTSTNGHTVTINASGGGSGTNTYVPTNIFSALADGEVVICPFTNLPASITNSGKYFTPLLGANYVQQAFNSLQYYGNVAQVSGGRVTVVGTNFTPVSIYLTNTVTSNMPCSWDIEAPAFITGAIVGSQNPVLACDSTNSQSQFFMHNVILASTVDQATNLLELTSTFGRISVTYNWFGMWQTLTNNHIGTHQVGLTPPTTGPLWQGNLNAIYLIASNSDMVEVSYNSFLGLNTLLAWQPDHGNAVGNLFSYSGNKTTNLWPNSSPFYLGCAVVFKASASANNTWHFLDNYFYQTKYSYLVDTFYGPSVTLEHDGYEGTSSMVGLTNSSVTVINGDNDQGQPGVIGATSNPYAIVGAWAPTNIFVNVDPYNGYFVQYGHASLQVGDSENSGNTTGMTDNSGTGWSFDDSGNIGFNNMAGCAGLFTPSNGVACLLSNQVVPTSITFPSSGVGWVNHLGFSIEMYIQIPVSTIYIISKNGQQIFGGTASSQAVGFTVNLEPAEAFECTYSGGSPSAKYSPSQ
jgi:hypothetical protein